MNEPGPSFLLVDGNNVIHAWPELRRLSLRRKESARNELIRLLEGYQDFSEDRVVVVFDGRGETTNEVREPGSVQVFYSSRDSSADAIIERLAVSNAGKHRIVVATNDIPEQDAVVAAGGEAISVEALRGRIEAAGRERNRWLDSR